MDSAAVGESQSPQNSKLTVSGVLDFRKGIPGKEQALSTREVKIIEKTKIRNFLMANLGIFEPIYAAYVYNIILVRI